MKPWGPRSVSGLKPRSKRILCIESVDNPVQFRCNCQENFKNAVPL